MLNSDDTFFDNDAIAKITSVFQSQLNIDCVYCNLIFVNKANNIVRKWKSKPFQSGLFAKSWTPAHPTFYCRKVLYEKFGLYKTNYKIAADLDFMLRLLEIHKVNSFYLPETIVKMSMGGNKYPGLKKHHNNYKRVTTCF